jgi:plastocyanin
MARAVRLILGIVLAATALAGCSSATSGSNASPVATTTVDLPASYRFVPAAISVHPGDTVTWTNDDHFTHSVQFLDGGLPTDPMEMQPGQSVTFTFPSPGTFSYQCHLHPQNMKGSVTVAP